VVSSVYFVVGALIGAMFVGMIAMAIHRRKASEKKSV